MKHLLFLVFSFVCLSLQARSYDGLFFCFSMEENKYSDNSIEVEIIGTDVYLTNRLNEVIYLDPKKTFFYEAGSGINKTDADVIMSVQPNSRILVHTFFDGFDHYVFTTRKDLGPSAIGGALGQIPFSGYKELGLIASKYVEESSGKIRMCPQTGNWLDFVAAVGELYNNRKSSKKDVMSVHLTKDESILIEKVSLAYSLSSDYSNPTSVSVSTWVSDIFLSKYEKDEAGSTKKDGFGSRTAKYTKISIMADSPFDYLDPDQEVSPIKCFSIGFGKGFFILQDTWTNRGRAVFIGEEAADKKKKK